MMYSIPTPQYNKYNTDEAVIGTWIDGKPIYRKVITGIQLPKNGDTIVNTGITTVDTMITIKALFYDKEWDYFSVIPYVHDTDINIQLSMSFTKSNGSLCFRGRGSDHSTQTAYCILEYTKS